MIDSSKNFSVENFKQSYKFLKYLLRPLKYAESSTLSATEFILAYHKELSSIANKIDFKQSLSQMTSVYRILSDYESFISKYGIEDQSLKQFLVTLNNCIFD